MTGKLQAGGESLNEAQRWQLSSAELLDLILASLVQAGSTLHFVIASRYAASQSSRSCIMSINRMQLS